MGGYYDRATALVQSCAKVLERHGQKLGILRDLEATQSSTWLKDMADEMRKACEEDVGTPGWHAWISALLLRNKLIERSLGNTTAADLEMRKILEDALRKALSHDAGS